MISDNPYSGFIRVRVGGLYLENNRLLLVKLTSPISGEEIWTPPGGGVQYKESLKEAVSREFLEETSLSVRVGDFLFGTELIEKEFHVLEFFYEVTRIEGSVKLGSDPEHGVDEQLLSEIGFFSREEIREMNVKPEFLKKDFWDREVESLFLGNR